MEDLEGVENGVDRQKGRVSLWAWVVGVVVGILVIVSGLFYFFGKPAADKPAVLGVFQKQVDFPLYYPNNLPADYKLDEASISSGDGVVIYQIAHSSGDKINVSLQKKPDGYDFEEFYRETLQSPKSELLPIGKVTFGKINRGSLTSIESSQTWILINSISPLEYDQLKPIIERFHPVY